MAATFTLKSHSYDGRYLELSCKQTPNRADNTSKIQWTLSSKGGESAAYTTGPTTVKIGGNTVYYKAKTSYSTGDFPAAKGSVSGTTEVAHDENGEAKISVSIKTNIYTGVLKTTSDSWTLEKIDRYAILTAVTDFTDEEDPVITIANPAGDQTKSLRGCICLNGEDLIIRELEGSQSKEVFALTEEERTLLRSKTPTNPVLELTFALRSVLNGVAYESTKNAKMTVVNAAPQVSVQVTDTNEATVAVTGNASILVAGYSIARVSLQAQAKKGAGIVSTQVVQGDTVTEGSSLLSPVGSEPITVYATDSRGNTASVTAENRIIPYIAPTCYLENSVPSGEGVLDLTVTGKYYPGSLGAGENTLAVFYRCKTDGEDYGDWIAMDIAASGDSYTAQKRVVGLDYQKTYTFQAKAADRIVTAGIGSGEKKFVATPVFDWSQSDFRFHVPVTFRGKSLLDFVYPVDSIYISYSHKNPEALFGGKWERLTEAFLWAADENAPIGPTDDGEKTHTLTASEMPSHTHELKLTSTSGTGDYTTSYVAYTKTGGTAYENDNAMVAAGGGLAHNNMPPYMNVSVWRRIA